jgi:hypothetical protein
MVLIRKPHVYLKTYVYSPHEVKMVRLNVRESFPYVDRFIICEYNRTHLGTPRDFIFDQYLHDFDEGECKKIIYLPCDISQVIHPATTNEQIHSNENLMRGYFTTQVDLHQNDIVVSLDADEIIFGRTYDKLISQIGYFKQAIQLRLHTFFYKINYLWQDEIFTAPTIARVSYYKHKYPGQWRYDGEVFPQMAGSHYSWCLPVEEMINKLQVYGHHFDYGHLAKRKVLEQAIQNKTYPFDPGRKFQIRVLNINEERDYYPEKIFDMLDDFKDLIV